MPTWTTEKKKSAGAVATMLAMEPAAPTVTKKHCMTSAASASREGPSDQALHRVRSMTLYLQAVSVSAHMDERRRGRRVNVGRVPVIKHHHASVSSLAAFDAMSAAAVRSSAAPGVTSACRARRVRFRDSTAAGRGALVADSADSFDSPADSPAAH